VLGAAQGIGAGTFHWGALELQHVSHVVSRWGIRPPSPNFQPAVGGAAAAVVCSPRSLPLLSSGKGEGGWTCPFWPPPTRPIHPLLLAYPPPDPKVLEPPGGREPIGDRAIVRACLPLFSNRPVLPSLLGLPEAPAVPRPVARPRGLVALRGAVVAPAGGELRLEAADALDCRRLVHMDTAHRGPLVAMHAVPCAKEGQDGLVAEEGGRVKETKTRPGPPSALISQAREMLVAMHAVPVPRGSRARLHARSSTPSS